jgi:hypothetical protein
MGCGESLLPLLWQAGLASFGLLGITAIRKPIVLEPIDNRTAGGITPAQIDQQAQLVTQPGQLCDALFGSGQFAVGQAADLVAGIGG